MYQNRQKKIFFYSKSKSSSFGSLVFPTALHILQEQLKSDHTLIKFSNIGKLEADLKSSGRLFQI